MSIGFTIVSPTGARDDVIMNGAWSVGSHMFAAIEAAMRPMNRGALADMRRTGKQLRVERDQRWADAMKRSRENRAPKPEPVMPAVAVGDTVLLAGVREATVVKVNRKSIVTTGGNRWAVGEFEVIA